MSITKSNKTTIYTLLNSVVFALFVGSGLFLMGQRNICIGFVFGALLSLFSFASLRMFIPQLFRPGASVQSSVALTLILFFKLPIYGALLYAAFRYCTVPLSILAGCCLTPCVITLETLAKMALEKSRRHKIVVPVLTPHAADSEKNLAPKSVDRDADTLEPNSATPRAKRVREGAS